MESLRPIRWRVPPDRRQAAESDRGLVCTPVKATMPALRSTHSIGRPASSQALRREWAVPALLSSHHASYVRADIGNVEPRTRSVSGIDFFTVPHEDSRFVFSTPQLLTGDSEVRSIPTARAREDRWRARAPGHHAGQHGSDSMADAEASFARGEDTRSQCPRAPRETNRRTGGVHDTKRVRRSPTSSSTAP